MSLLKCVVVSTVLWLGVNALNLTFPPDFIFGAGTSAYQIEGGVNENGRSESLWDRYIKNNPSVIADGSSGEVACDSYHQWQLDVDAVVELGLDYYRFSISWARLLPTGLSNHINEDGKNYYNRLIDSLLEKGVKPLVTIYHWDIPQRLQDLGGWANPLVADWFAEYANVVFSLYADRVPFWITINEPYIMCDLGYAAMYPPGVLDYDFGRYLCSKHTLLAHAKAWRIYDEVYRPKYHGKITLINQIIWPEPKTDSDEDLEAAELATEQGLGRFSYPIYTEKGGWPDTIKNAIAQKSKEEGYVFSRLPDFTEDEIELMKGTSDFFALNYYTSRVVHKKRAGEKDSGSILSGDSDLGYEAEIDNTLKGTASYWFKQYPKGLRRAMQWITKKYGDVPFLITEVGYSSITDTLEDYDRIEFFRSYMEQILLAMNEDKIKVMGFFAWSLLDNFEWLDGYSAKFGLYAVDFEDPKRRRTPRLSAKYYAGVIRNRTLDVPEYMRNSLLCLVVFLAFTQPPLGLPPPLEGPAPVYVSRFQ